MTKKSTAQPLFVSTTKGEVLPWSLLSEFAVKAGEGEQSRVLPTDRFASQYADQGLIAPLYDLETIVALLEINTWHFKCCDAKASDTAGIGYGFKAAEGEEIPEADEKEVKDFFNDNSRHGRPVSHVLVDAQMDFESMGIMAIEIVRELYDPNGKPALMAHIPGHTIRPHSSGNKYLQMRGTQKLWFKAWGYDRDIDMNDGTEYELGSLPVERRATEVIWDQDYSGRSDFYGMPQIIPALGAVEGMRALRDYNISFFRSYGIPSYAIYITGDYNLGELVRFRKEADGSGTIGEVYDPDNPNDTVTNFQYKIIGQIKRHLATLTQNPHAPLILAVPGTVPESKINLEFKPLNIEVKEASFRLYRKDNRDEILVVHGVPPYRVGVNETGSLGGNTAKESSKIYRDSVVKPRKERLASLINTHIIKEGFEVKTVEFYFYDLDITDEGEDREIAEFLVDHGAMTPRELRNNYGDRFNLEDVEGHPELDQFYYKGQQLGSSSASDAESNFVEAVKGFQTDLLKIVVKSME